MPNIRGRKVNLNVFMLKRRRPSSLGIYSELLTSCCITFHESLISATLAGLDPSQICSEMVGAVPAPSLLDIKGRVLVWRDYRGDVSAVQAERFLTKLIEKDVCFSFFTLQLNIVFFYHPS
ncbi:hypothetical protein SAY86_009109 [Trapa natans]|uniref:Uncharacterized protein n=1 Tax=Trapa natans TaxID=22666 RepID=A0AAN7KFY2_TRANT|nr:hypothetical protein SAY86_009109 [Trapa natans]